MILAIFRRGRHLPLAAVVMLLSWAAAAGAVEAPTAAMCPPPPSLLGVAGYEELVPLVDGFVAAAPADWSKRTVVPGNVAYHYEKAMVSRDDDPQYGVDTADVVFFLGHGAPGSWQLGNKLAVSVNSVLLGPPRGRALYYWQCACRVFAHGPDVNGNYISPSEFHGSADDDTSRMANVLYRWRDALTPGLRMACGGSSEVTCAVEGSGETVGGRFWKNLRDRGYDLADSLLLAIRADRTKVVPLCLTRGSQDPTQSPLYDPDFVREINGGGSYFHIEYTETQTVSDRMPIPSRGDDPAEVIPALAASAHVAYATAAAGIDTGEPHHQVVRCPDRPQRWEDVATFLCPAKTPPATVDEVDTQRFLTAARHFVIDEEGWASDAEVRGTGMTALWIDSYDDKAPTRDPWPHSHGLKSVLLRFQRPAVDVPLTVKPIEEFDGGEIVVLLDSQAKVRAAYRDWRAQPLFVLPAPGEAWVSAKAARKQAYALIGDKEESHYAVERQTWGVRNTARGYETAFHFDFVPAPGIDLARYPPRAVEVPAIQRPRD
ncbi:MAG TPA: hypothetical protein VGS57_09895 [Thermoanaerobaculia bacterium]|jgi:hypothetical protein|nr:hypothetical protein [Thermoanaerobaculia bacterium]